MRLPLLTTALAAMLLASPARADTITASQDTFVTTHLTFGGPTSTHGNDEVLQVIGAPGFVGEFYARALLQFDLSAYAGATIAGDATLELYLHDDHPNGAPSFTQVHLLTGTWSEATANWNNQPGMGAVVGSRAFDPPAEVGTWVSWTISGSALQGWINNPSTNHGLLIESEPGAAFDDLVFRSSEHAGGFGPKLTFNTSPNGVPEPGTVALAAVAGAATLVRRARRKGPQA